MRLEGASRYTVSRDGRRYTFFVRPGLRFSNGERVTARNFAYALNRALGRKLQSPAFQFLIDPLATKVFGAEKVRKGKARSASGIVVRGNRLIIRLTKPSPMLLTDLAMPFFQAISTRLPRAREVVGVQDRNDLPTAGPYYVAIRRPNESITLRRNPFYSGARPRRVRRIEFRAQVDAEAGFARVLAGLVDYQQDIPPDQHAALGRTYGVNRSQYWVLPTNCLLYMALNTASALFRDNVALRRAVNFAVDRGAVSQVDGAYAARGHDQILPPLMPGYRDANLYPLGPPNLARARDLARGNLRGGRAVVFHSSVAPGPERADIVRRNLGAIGLTVELRSFRGFFDPDRHGVDFSLFLGLGVCGEYPDPSTVFNPLLYGGALQQDGNGNLANFDQPAYNRRMERAATLHGEARLRAYGKLDVDIMRNEAPWAPLYVLNNRIFLGRRIDPRSFVYHPVYEAPVYNALALRLGLRRRPA